MSLKQEIETWVAALAQYDSNNYAEALEEFKNIADTSKILFNCGVIHATLTQHEDAVKFYQRAVQLDKYLAVAYFQQGVSNFLMGDFEEALANFNDTLLYLRGNNNIDYEQLGLKFKLYSCEVLFNRGLCYIYLQQKETGMQDLSYAAKEKVVPDHDVIDEAIREEAQDYTVFSIPIGIVYRPNEAKVKNLKTKDYLGKPRLVAALDRTQAFTGFSGTEMNKISESGARDDRPEEKLSYAAINLVKPNLQSRSRQQSEPPLNRNMFPPTPPPEQEKRNSTENRQMTRAQSVRGGGPKPPPLSLGRAAFDQSQSQEPTRRIGTTRSASERPPASRMDVSRSRDGGRSRRRGSDEDLDGYEEVYDLYQGRSNRPSFASRSRQAKPSRPVYIEEEEEDDYVLSDELEDTSFEMVSRSNKPQIHQQRRSASRREPAAPALSPKIRVKVHASDTRYVFITPSPQFTLRDFSQQIRDKFGMRSNFKIEIKDDGDMITMADDDDLDMACQTARAEARRQNAEMAKMEVWLRFLDDDYYMLAPQILRAPVGGNEALPAPAARRPGITVAEFF